MEERGLRGERRGRSWSVPERVAYHEAGHAVVAYALHRRFTKVSIIPDEDTLGRLSHQPLRNFHPDIDASLATRRNVERAVMILFGGDVVESLLTGKQGRLTGIDFKNAVGVAEYLCGDTEEAGAYASWLWARTTNLLKLPHSRAAVGALAKVLLVKQEVGYREARRVIEAAIQEQYAHTKGALSTLSSTDG